MKINTTLLLAVLTFIFTAVLALEAWTLNEIVNLKVSLAQLSAQVSTLSSKSIAKAP